MNEITHVFVRGLGWRELREITDDKFTVRLGGEFYASFPLKDMCMVIIKGSIFTRNDRTWRNTNESQLPHPAELKPKKLNEPSRKRKR